MYKQEMLKYLFEAYQDKGLNLWRLPGLDFIRINGGLDLDAIVKGAPVQKLEMGNVYLAAPPNHDNGSVEEALNRLFVKCFGFNVAIYTFGVSDRIFATREDGSIIDFNYFEFINAVEKLPSLNGVQKNGKNPKSPNNSRL